MVQGVQATTYGTFELSQQKKNDLHTTANSRVVNTAKVYFGQMSEKAHINPDAIKRLMETMGNQSARDLKAMLNRNTTFAETEPLLKK